MLFPNKILIKYLLTSINELVIHEHKSTIKL